MYLTSYVMVDGIAILFYFISFHFLWVIMFQLYGVLNLLCFGRWNSQTYFYYITVTDVIVTGVRCYQPIGLSVNCWFLML